MKFDKARVYTALNADELKVGSKVICGNTLMELKKNVHYAEDIKHLKRINDEFKEYRFYCGADSYSLAYLIEPPEIDTNETENGWNFDFHKIPQKPQGEILILFENGFMSRYQDPFPIGQLAIAWRVIPILSKKKRKHIAENMLRKYK